MGKYNIGKVNQQGKNVDLSEAVATAIGPGASVSHDGKTYTVPPGRMGVKVLRDGTVEYF